MTHQTLYRKYRPQTFADVRGQESVVELFQNSILKNKIGHAYLFSGGRGTGKTSVARIFAKEIGTAPEDIYEIDAASNRGIDEVRAVRESVHTLPMSSKYKVYIIDEAHMLTPQAANALLKTLEEPPAHVIFILATTDKHKLPATIISRCQFVEFKKATKKILKECVVEIAKKEGITIDDEALEHIALVGDGSYRDTFSYLETCLINAGSDKHVSMKDISAISIQNISTIGIELLQRIQKKDTNNTLVYLEGISHMQAEDIANGLVEAIRNALVLRFDTEGKFKASEMATLGEDAVLELDILAKDSQNPLTSQTLVKAIDGYAAIVGSSHHKWFLLEALCIELSS